MHGIMNEIMKFLKRYHFKKAFKILFYDAKLSQSSRIRFDLISGNDILIILKRTHASIKDE